MAPCPLSLRPHGQPCCVLISCHTQLVGVDLNLGSGAAGMAHAQREHEGPLGRDPGACRPHRFPRADAVCWLVAAVPDSTGLREGKKRPKPLVTGAGPRAMEPGRSWAWADGRMAPGRRRRQEQDDSGRVAASRPHRGPALIPLCLGPRLGLLGDHGWSAADGRSVSSVSGGPAPFPGPRGLPGPVHSPHRGVALGPRQAGQVPGLSRQRGRVTCLGGRETTRGAMGSGWRRAASGSDYSQRFTV